MGLSSAIRVWLLAVLACGPRTTRYDPDPDSLCDKADLIQNQHVHGVVVEGDLRVTQSAEYSLYLACEARTKKPWIAVQMPNPMNPYMPYWQQVDVTHLTGIGRTREDRAMTCKRRALDACRAAVDAWRDETGIWIVDDSLNCKVAKISTCRVAGRIVPGSDEGPASDFTIDDDIPIEDTPVDDGAKSDFSDPDQAPAADDDANDSIEDDGTGP